MGIIERVPRDLPKQIEGSKYETRKKEHIRNVNNYEKSSNVDLLTKDPH
jgi:hypothetical protein